MVLSFSLMHDVDLRVRSGAYLPHWTKEGAIYHVRLRLSDSLPQATLNEWKEEREELMKKAAQEGGMLTKAEQEQFEFLFLEKVEKYLDAGYGACWLQQSPIATVVRDALMYFDDDHYKLLAWCIMPNHVHIILQPLFKELSDILKSWKTYTANKANRILKRSGAFWQREYFDRIARDQEDLERMAEYVWQNPENAGLKNWQWRWRIDAEA